MILTDKIKISDTFFNIDGTPFNFNKVGGKRRFRKSIYSDLIAHGAYLVITPTYDATTHRLAGTQTFNKDHFIKGIVEITEQDKIAKLLRRVDSQLNELSIETPNGLEVLIDRMILLGKIKYSDLHIDQQSNIDRKRYLRALRAALSDGVITSEEAETFETTVPNFFKRVWIVLNRRPWFYLKVESGKCGE